MNRKSIVFVFAALLFSFPAWAQHEAKTLKKTVTTELELNYLLHVPKSYQADGDPWPLVLFLHGAGERGSDLNKVKAHGPPKLVEMGQSLPAIIVSPQSPEGEWWNDQVDALSALLDEVEKNYNVDPKRIYVTGLSMGGYGTWALGSSDPDRFAALLPICGGGMSVMARRLIDTPIWAFHGDADVVVALEESQRMVDALTRFGNKKTKFTVYPGVNHDSWTATYNNPEVWKWLLEQKRE